MKGMGRYWGYLLFAVVIMGWTTRDFPFVAIIVLSLASNPSCSFSRYRCGAAP